MAKYPVCLDDFPRSSLALGLKFDLFLPFFFLLRRALKVTLFFHCVHMCIFVVAVYKIQYSIQLKDSTHASFLALCRHRKLERKGCCLNVLQTLR